VPPPRPQNDRVSSPTFTQMPPTAPKAKPAELGTPSALDIPRPPAPVPAAPLTSAPLAPAPVQQPVAVSPPAQPAAQVPAPPAAPVAATAFNNALESQQAPIPPKLSSLKEIFLFLATGKEAEPAGAPSMAARAKA
jgi:hypothetical protein